MEFCIARNSVNWKPPAGAMQLETITFHRVRALRELSGMSQTFICERSPISNAALSLYLRCLFIQRQDSLEEKLGTFIDDYLGGKYYDDAYKTNWFRNNAR